MLMNGNVQAQADTAVESPAVIVLGIVHVCGERQCSSLGTALLLECIVGTQATNEDYVNGIVVLLAKQVTKVYQHIGTGRDVVVTIMTVGSISQEVNTTLVPSAVYMQAGSHLGDKPPSEAEAGCGCKCFPVIKLRIECVLYTALYTKEPMGIELIIAFGLLCTDR